MNDSERQNEAQEPGGSVARLIGLILMVVSALWMAFSGLCAASMVVSMLAAEGFNDYVAVWVVGTLLISGISAAMGYAVFVVGRSLRASK